MKKLKIVFLFLSIFLLVGCNVYNKKNDSPQIEVKEQEIKKIDYFEFNYGSNELGYFEYTIKEDQYFKLIYKAYDGSNNVIESLDEYITESDVKKLSELVHKINLDSWDDFNEQDNSTIGGYSFNIRIGYKNNTFIGCRGYMKYPDDYFEKSDQLLKFLNDLIAKKKNEQKIIVENKK